MEYWRVIKQKNLVRNTLNKDINVTNEEEEMLLEELMEMDDEEENDQEVMEEIQPESKAVIFLSVFFFSMTQLNLSSFLQIVKTLLASIIEKLKLIEGTKKKRYFMLFHLKRCNFCEANTGK